MKQAVLHPPLKDNIMEEVVKINSNETICFVEQNAENHI